MEISGSIEMTEPMNQTITSDGQIIRIKLRDDIVASQNEIKEHTEEQEKPTENSDPDMRI